MKKIGLFLIILVFLAACDKVSEQPKEPKEPVCGDNICDNSEKEKDSCPKDCGSVKSITPEQCEEAGGKWNECGSACAGTGAEMCIQVCKSQSDCGGIAGFRCPEGLKCRLSRKIADEIGVCVRA